MPSPSRNYARRSPPAASSSPLHHRRRESGAGGAAASSLAIGDRDPSESDGPSVARRRVRQNDYASDAAGTVGKRTGVTLPPRGEIPLDSEGLEDADAFFAAARSPASPAGSHGSGSPGRAYGRRAERAARERQRAEERRRRRDELEEEGQRNAERRPEILNRHDNDDGDGDDNEGDEDDGGGKPRAKYQPTPRQPGWTNRSLHRAMGVPTEDSPAYTVLSKVSTAAPSTRGSVDTIATEGRHGLRARGEGAQLDALASRSEKGRSPPAAMDASGGEGEGAEDEGEAEFGGAIDPPEEMSQESSRGERRGVDPVERDVLLEPEEHQQEQEGEEEEEEGVLGKKSAESATDEFDDVLAKRSSKNATSGDDASAKPSATSTAHSAASSLDGNVPAKLSAKSAASGRTDPLEGSLEEVVRNSNYNDDYSGDDEGMDGGMRFAAQEREERLEEEEEEEDVDFRGGNDGGDFRNDDNDDALDNHNDALDDNGDAMSHQASYVSEKSRKSNHSYKTHRSESSYKSHASSHKSSRSQKSKNSKNGASEQSPSSSEEEEEEKPYYVEEEPPKKKKAKGARKQAPAFTPTSVLRTKKSKKKKKNQPSNNHVNWSTPTGNATGRPMGNRDYEAVPVSEYKEEYPSGEEPKTPGGSTLRRSRRARFNPLQFWKNERVIYEAQNEKGLLGEAMGDMPVVAGVMRAMPTPYKEAKRKKEPPKKKKRKGDGSDDDSDDDTKRSKSPFDDRPLRKKYRIRNGESGSVWSETLESATDVKIVSRLDNRSFSRLPLSSARRKRESKVVGFASQAFHVLTDADDLFPGYIAGNVVLPPRGIKDAEGVGLCSQVFNVGDCQPNSVEFAVADPSGEDGEFDPRTAQRFLLGKGDMFQIPPGNVYRIENHSRTEKANLFWTIIKCTSRAEQDDSGDEEEEEEN